MSREIDLSDPSSLSEADIKYLQDRGRRPAGVPAVHVDAPEARDISEVPHTGDVNTPKAGRRSHAAKAKAEPVAADEDDEIIDDSETE